MSTAKVIPCLSRTESLVFHLREKISSVNFYSISFFSKDGTYRSRLSEDDMKILSKAEVIVCDPDLIAEYNLLPDKLPSLKYMQSTFAGVDKAVKLIDLSKGDPSFTLARAGGCFGGQISEYVIARMISQERDFNKSREAQTQKIWHRNLNFRDLSLCTLGVLGVGDIGSHVARAGAFFNMTVWGLVSKPRPAAQQLPYINQYRTVDGLAELLSSCDFICNTLPSTPHTRGLLDGDILSHCKDKKPVFINVGRGDIISIDTIIRALDHGWLSHAILDVFPEEPLPTDSPLWHHPNVTISGHDSGVSYGKPVAEAFARNYQKYIAGEKLDYAYNWSSMY